MDSRLQKFARLVETGSFTRAAEQLHISQPALSIAIEKLERELGATLLIRTNRKLELTEAGQAAYRTALEHQNSTDQLRGNLARLARKRPQVQIGVIDSLAGELCMSSAFERLESTTDVTVVVNNSRYLREAVKQRQIDVAFVVDDSSEHAALAKTAIGEEQLIFVCHPSTVAAAERGLKAGRLDNFICYDKPSTTYRHVQHSLRTANVRPQISLFSTSPDVMLRMVLAGKGVAALPKQMVKDHLKTGELVALLTPIRRPLCRTELTGKTQDPALQRFLAEVL